MFSIELFAGPVIQRSAIIVDKNERESRQQAQREVQEWFEKREQNPALLPHRLSLTPEGWFTNGSKILNFKTGAFKPGRPVQPVVFKWGSRFAPIMTYGQDMSWFWTVLIQLAVPSTQLTAKILPVYHPNQGKVKEIVLSPLPSTRQNISYDSFHSRWEERCRIVLHERGSTDGQRSWNTFSWTQRLSLLGRNQEDES